VTWITCENSQSPHEESASVVDGFGLKTANCGGGDDAKDPPGGIDPLERMVPVVGRRNAPGVRADGGAINAAKGSS